MEKTKPTDILELFLQKPAVEPDETFLESGRLELEKGLVGIDKITG